MPILPVAPVEVRVMKTTHWNHAPTVLVTIGVVIVEMPFSSLMKKMGMSEYGYTHAAIVRKDAESTPTQGV